MRELLAPKSAASRHISVALARQNQKVLCHTGSDLHELIAKMRIPACK